jgi:glutamate decarboxylase
MFSTIYFIYSSIREININIFNSFFPDLLPHNLFGQAPTKEFLLKVVDILIDYIKDVNDRDEKVLHFKQPEEMLRLLNLDLPDEGMPLQNLVDDCNLTLQHQVKTGKISSVC